MGMYLWVTSPERLARLDSLRRGLWGIGISHDQYQFQKFGGRDFGLDMQVNKIFVSMN